MSSTMRSNGSARARRCPASASVSVATSWPAASSTSTKSSRLSRLSSTSSSRMEHLRPLLPRRDPREPALEALVVDGLGEMVVGAHALRLTLVVVDGHHDHRQVGGRRVALEYFEELLPATVGQTQVEDDRRRDGSGDGRDALVDGGRDLGRQPVLRGQRDDEVRVAALVLDDEHASRSRDAGDDVGKTHAEGRSRAEAAGEVDRPAVQLDEALGQRESEAGAGRMRRSLVEALERAEDPRVLILWDAEARVDDLELEVVRGRPQVEADPTAGRRELHRVRQEVEQDLADPPGIEIHARAFVGGRFEADVLLAGALARRGEHRREQRPDRERLRPELNASCLDLREIEHVVDQREEVISGVADISKIALLAVGGRGRELLLEQVGKADD